MSILLSVHQLAKSFSARPLFKALSFSVQSSDRIGLIGPNGAGKSTLLKILASRVDPDDGKISFQKGLRVGFLEQVPEFKKGATLMESILEGAGHLEDWEASSKAEELISKFDLGQFSPDTLMTALSGGWKKRVALARELVASPDLLLLDEPTNHLDVESILWLEEFLAKSNFATITITHDRVFLQNVANRIVELDPRHDGGLLNVQGDYTDYLEIRDQLISAQERREVVLKNTLRRETEWLRQGAKARTTKQQARIQRAGELKENVEDLSQRNQDRKVRIDFQSSEKSPKKLIEAKGVSKSYGAKQVFSGLNLLLTPGARIGLLGPNGSGKSTVIKTLLGFEEPTSGTVMRSDQISLAYFDQTRDTLDSSLSVAKTLCPAGEYVDYRGSRVHIRGYLDRFLFEPGQMDMAVGKLSGGEQSRLLIARLMLTQANVLVLDEPTNDLDLATLNVLQDCLTEFAGAVILVTHDRYFLDQVANRILAFDPSGQSPELVAFANLRQWETWRTGLKKNPTGMAKTSGGTMDGSSAGKPKKDRLGFKEKYELESMEATIQKTEETLGRLEIESSRPENTSNAIRLGELTREMAGLQGEIERLYRRWGELEKKQNGG